ncbi:MAG: hypothetical protein ACRD3Q_06825 [Terriglobales bacterium]
MEPRVIAQCHYCHKPIVQGDNMLCLKHPTKNAYLFIHVRFEDGKLDCSHQYLHKNGGAAPLFFNWEEWDDAT